MPTIIAIHIYNCASIACSLFTLTAPQWDSNAMHWEKLIDIIHISVYEIKLLQAIITGIIRNRDVLRACQIILNLMHIRQSALFLT